MKTTMKAHSPQLLPWFAHKAGISERRAEVLWAAAQRHAAVRCGETGTSAYWQTAMDRLVELIAAESLREDAASFGWRPWSRAQARFWSAPVEALDAMTLAATRGWRLIGEKLGGGCCLFG